MATAKRNKGGRPRTDDTRAMDARAYELYRKGLTYPQIGEQIGLSASGARESVRRGAAEAGRDPFAQAEAMQIQADRAQDRRRILLRIAYTRHFVVDQGHVVMSPPDPVTGKSEPMIDPAPNMRAVDLLRKEDEKEERLLDLLPPTKQRVEVVASDVVLSELARLRDKLPPHMLQAVMARLNAAGMLPAGEGAVYAITEPPESRGGPGDAGDPGGTPGR